MANFLDEIKELGMCLFNEAQEDLEALMLKDAFNGESVEDLLSAITCKYSRSIADRVKNIVKTYNECPDVVLGNVFDTTFCISKIDGIIAYIPIILEKNADGIWEYSHMGKIEWETSPFKTRKGVIILNESHMAFCSEDVKRKVENSLSA